MLLMITKIIVLYYYYPNPGLLYFLQVYARSCCLSRSSSFRSVLLPSRESPVAGGGGEGGEGSPDPPETEGRGAEHRTRAAGDKGRSGTKHSSRQTK